jgi:NAD(P)-dependent dehydrogenase (short-subunit alcohol dehydrogenase family)
MKSDFKDKVVLVTGSGSGIGKATALAFCSAGAKVILNGRNEEKLLRTQLEFEQLGYAVNYCVGDTTNYHDCCWLTDYVMQLHGKIDVVVANASVSMNGRFEETKPHFFKTTVDSNIYSVVMPLFSFLPHLKKTNGSFTIISSIAALRGMPTGSAYCVGKMALTALHQSLSAEFAIYKIHLGIIYVGFTENDADKKTFSPCGELIPVPKRIKLLQQSQKKVAGSILSLIKRRKSKTILTITGKITNILSRVSPGLFMLMAKQSQLSALKKA